MEVSKEGNKIKIEHELKEGENYKISKGSKFEGVSFFKKPRIVHGYSNVCGDGNGILVIDYDKVDESIILEDYSLLQRLYKLCQGYLFKTSDQSFHVVCLRKFRQSTIFEILQNTRSDEAFKSMNLRNPFRSYVLRISSKGKKDNPKFIKLIGKKFINNFQTSYAHYQLLNKIYPKIKHPMYKNPDMLQQLKIHTYES